MSTAVAATVTLERAALFSAIQAVFKVVERRSTIPILGNLLVETRDGRIVVTGTDLDMSAEASAPADGLDIGPAMAFTASADRLHEIVRKIDDGAQISLSPGDNAVTLRTGKARFSLQTLPASDFPTLASSDFGHRFAIAPAKLLRLFSTVEFAISTEETRYYLNGIYLHVVEVEGAPILRTVATDGHRLARDQEPAPNGTAGMPGVIVPRKFVGEAVRLLGALKTGADVTVEISAAKIRLTCGTTVLTSKLVDGNFPDYARVIPAGNDKVLTVDKTAFAAAVDRIVAVVSEKSRQIRLDIDAERLRLSASSVDVGDAHDEIEAEFDGAEETAIGMNGRYLLDILAHLPCDTLSIRIADAEKAFLIEPHPAGTAQMVLMPIRLK